MSDKRALCVVVYLSSVKGLVYKQVRGSSVSLKSNSAKTPCLCAVESAQTNEQCSLGKLST